MIKVRRISHATFETPDLDQLIDHFTKVTGLVVAAREPNRALLATKLGQLVLQLKRGEQPRCAKLSFQVAPDLDFGEIGRWLTQKVINSGVRSDGIPVI